MFFEKHICNTNGEIRYTLKTHQSTRGHKKNNMSLVVYSASMKIEPLVVSINKLA